MKKRLIAILVLLIVLTMVLTACDLSKFFSPEQPDEPIQHTVSFVSNGGSAVEDVKVNDGELAIKPADPTKEGYNFLGWYKDEALTQEWSFDTDRVTADVVLYAKWEEQLPIIPPSPPVHEVTFSGADISKQRVEDGKTAEKPEDPTKDGFTFEGWFKDEACTLPFDFATPITGNITLYAKWRENTPVVKTTTIVLDPEDSDATLNRGPQNIRLGDFEIILSSENSRIDGDSSSKTWTLDGGEPYKLKSRINFNGSATVFENGEFKNAVKFVTGGKATVTVYWVHAGKGSEGVAENGYRNVGIWDAQGNLLDQSIGEHVYEATMITTFELAEAGTYYLGNVVHANYFFRVEVTYEGEKVSLPDLVKHTVTFNANGGSEVAALEVVDGDWLTKPANPTKDGFEFDGWYKDEALETPFDFANEKITAPITLYAKWSEKVGEYEDVHYEVDIATLATGTAASDIIASKFTIISGTEIRNRTKTWTDPEDSSNIKEFTKSVKLGSSSATIKVSAPGTGKLAFYIQNGSSGADMQKVKITAPDGSVSEMEFVGNASGNPVVRLTVDVTEGDWLIQRVSGTIDIFALELDCSVPVSPENGFELVQAGKVDYIIGEDIDISGIVLNGTYESGKTEPLALTDVTVDTSAYNKAVAGTYEITITYKTYTPIKYSVTVFAPQSIKLDFDAVEKTGSSSAGNGVYFNHSFKEVYAIGEAFDSKGLSVTVICSDGAEGTKEFKVSISDVTITGFDSSAAGKLTLTISYDSVSATTDVYVVDTAPVKDGDTYKVSVDKAYTGVIGAAVDGYNRFTTIQQALDYLASRSEIKATDKKLIVIGEGKFTEKLEITIPNLTITGAGVDKTMIEWDSLYGIVDAGGFTHTTDSTATVAIRDAGHDCTITNLTISNAFNSKEYFDNTLGANYSEHRALALLVQSDRFVMKDAALLGYQDTVEFFTGRQYLKNVYIQGLTDFIFGTNNTTLFEECEIHSISIGKTDGGYVTAFKGMNKGSADAVQYGAVFYKCRFTAPEDVTANANTAIGRPWGAYAAVAVIECELGGHISKAASSGASKNERYVSMSGVKPTDETVKFVEYNNTGAGAITEAVAGMRFLTAEEAVKYFDFTVIFGISNGGVSYLDPWDPTSTDVIVDDRTYYFFDQGSSETGTSHTFDTTTTITKGEAITFGGLTISAENGNVAWNQNANSLNMKQGSFISFEVEAGTLVTVKAYSAAYNKFTLNGVGSATDTIIQYYSEATTVNLLSEGDSYLYSIVIDPNADALEASVLESITVEGFTVNYTVGSEVSLEGVVVKAHHSDKTFKAVALADVIVDTSAVNNAKAGTYAVVFTHGGKSVSVDVTFEDPNAAAEITKNTTLSFKSEADYNAVLNNPRVTTTGTFRLNGAEYQIQGTISFPVKAGTVVVVNPYNNSQYVSYTIGAEGEEGLATLSGAATYIAKKDCTVVYTGLSNNYLVSIDIICPIVNETYVFGSCTMEGDFKGILTSAGNLIVSGQDLSDNGDSAQLKETSIISFAVAPFSTVTVTGHSKGYGILTILVNDVISTIESDANGVYVIPVENGGMVKILCTNVGTSEAPAYNKSYIKAIKVDAKSPIDENTTISFGS